MDEILNDNEIRNHVKSNKKIGNSSKFSHLSQVEKEVMDRCIRLTHIEFYSSVKRIFALKLEDNNHECKSYMDETFRKNIRRISKDQAHKEVL